MASPAPCHHRPRQTRLPASRSADRTDDLRRALNKGIKRLELAFEHTPHAARTTTSTLLNEMGYRPDVIERQLAHPERNAVRRAYNRATYIEERRLMMQQWGDMLGELKSGEGKVVPIKKTEAA